MENYHQIELRAIDFASVADAENQDYQAVVFDATDNPEISDSIPPEFAQSGAFQGISASPWILQI